MSLHRYGLLLAGLVFINGSINAQTVYRWVDEHGQTHFSEHSRPGMKDESLTLRVTPARLPIRHSDENHTSTPPMTQSAPPAPEKTVDVSPAQAQQLCLDARQALSVLSERYSRRFIQPDGSVRPLTDDERNAQSRTANDAIARYCR